MLCSALFFKKNIAEHRKHQGRKKVKKTVKFGRMHPVNGFECYLWKCKWTYYRGSRVAELCNCLSSGWLHPTKFSVSALHRSWCLTKIKSGNNAIKGINETTVNKKKHRNTLKRSQLCMLRRALVFSVV